MIAQLFKWFFVLLPFVYYYGVLDASGTPRLLFLCFFLVLGFGIHLFKNQELKIPKTYGLLFLIYLLTCSSTSIINGNFIDYIDLIKRGAYFLFFILIYNLKDAKSESTLLKGIQVFIGISLFFGLTEFLLIALGEDPVENAFYAISTTFSHKNIFASVLLLSIPFCLLNKLKPTQFILVAGALLLCLLLQTRSVLLALLIAGVYLILSKRMLITKNLKLISTTSILLLGIGYLGLKQLGTLDYFINIFDIGNTDSLRSATISERMYLWSHSLQMFFDHWTLGVGVGQWPIYFTSYGLTLWRLRQGEVIMQRPHNDFLENFNELGVIGGCLFLGLMLYPLLKISKSKQKEFLNFGLICFLIISLFSFPQERIAPSLLFFSLVALKLRDSKSYTMKRGWRSLILFSLIFISFAVAHRLQSEVGFKRYMTQVDNIKPMSGIKILSEAKSPLFLVDGTSTPIDWYLGKLYLKNNDLQNANKHFDRAVKINPFHIHIMNSLGVCRIYEKKYLDADSFFRKALSIAPYFEEAMYNLSFTLYQRTKFDKAIDVLKNIENKEEEKCQNRLLMNAKSHLNLLLSNPNIEANKKDVLRNILYNEPWLKTIIFKSYEENRPFSTQLKMDVDYLLKN